MALNTADELDEELRSTGLEYTDLDYSRKLRQANNRLATMVGRQYQERYTVQYEENVVDLDFNRLESFDKVRDVSNDTVIDPSNYTVDNTSAQITFDQSYVDDNFEEGLQLIIYYTPSIFKDLELYIAMRNLLETEVVTTGTDELQGTITERLNARITAIVNRVNGQNSTAVQSGDNQNRGSQRPRTTNQG